MTLNWNAIIAATVLGLITFGLSYLVGYESRQGCKWEFRVVLVAVVVEPVGMCVSARGAVHISTGRSGQLAASSAGGSVGTSPLSFAKDSALK